MLARDRVRFVGDPIVTVIATSLTAAKDAAERIVVDYEAMPAAQDLRTAMAPNAPVVWDECPGNLSSKWNWGMERLSIPQSPLQHMSRVST